MNKNEIIEKVLLPVEDIALKHSLRYIEYLDGDENLPIFKKSFKTDFPHLSFKTLENNETVKTRDRETTLHIELASSYEHKIFCHLYPFKRESGIDTLLIETESGLSDELDAFISYVSGVMNNFLKTPDEKKPDGGVDRYKKELGNIRDIQAKLFPKFDEIKEMDIRSAYLPAEFMSGTFIDGLYLENSTYQLTACDVSGYGPASSFIGAAIRTIIRSDSSKKKIPSSMIESIMNKIKNIAPPSASNNNIYITIYQLNLKTGKTVISSYGSITTLFYTNRKSGLIDLATTSAGKLFSNRNFLRDMTINLEPDDLLLFYTRGIVKSKAENSELEYGLEKLKSETIDNIKSESLEIVHSIIESVYEFTDYAQLKEDLILISMKRNSN